MQYLKTQFETTQYYASLVLVPLVLFCIPLGQTAKSIAIVIALILICCNKNTLPNLRILATAPLIWAILALVGFSVLACIWSHADMHQKTTVIEKYSKLLFIPLFACGFFDKKTRQYGIHAYIVGMLITCCTYFYTYWFNNPLPGQGQLPLAGYIFYNHIVASYMMAVSCYLAAWKAVQSNRIGAKLCYVMLVMVFSSQLLILSASRTGYVIYALLFCLFFVQHFSLKYVRYSGLLFVVICAMMLQFSQSNTLVRGVHLISQNLAAYHSGHKDTSVGLRLQFHQYAQSLFRLNPIFGQGTGGFGYRFKEDNPVPEWGTEHPDPHSQYWHTASEFGLCGIFLLLLIFAMLFKLSFGLPEMKFILQATVLPFCLVCFSDTVLLTSGLGYLFVTFTGLCLGEWLLLNKSTSNSLTRPVSVSQELSLE